MDLILTQGPHGRRSYCDYYSSPLTSTCAYACVHEHTHVHMHTSKHTHTHTNKLKLLKIKQSLLHSENVKVLLKSGEKEL